MAVRSRLSRLPRGRTHRAPDAAGPAPGAASTRGGGASAASADAPRSTPPTRSSTRNQRGDQGRSAPVTVNAATGDRVVRIHRVGAFVVAGVLATFGILGFAGGLPFFATEGQRVIGLSSNGLLSTISLVVAVVLVVAGIRGGRTASTVMFAVGVLFLLSAMWHLLVLTSAVNVLAFTMANVVFSIVAGIVLLTLGAFGRVSGNIPRENPYYRQDHADDQEDDGEEPETAPTTPAELRAERDMRAAEIAVFEHRASPEQTRRVEAMARVRSKTERRRVWLEHTGG